MFKRPGSLSKSAFGVNYDSGRQQQPPTEPPRAEGPAQKRARKDQLPAESVRRELLYLVENHATVVVVGETGCGKTTQIPRFLHEAGWTADGYQARPADCQLIAVWADRLLTCGLHSHEKYCQYTESDDTQYTESDDTEIKPAIDSQADTQGAEGMQTACGNTYTVSACVAWMTHIALATTLCHAMCCLQVVSTQPRPDIAAKSLTARFQKKQLCQSHHAVLCCGVCCAVVCDVPAGRVHTAQACCCSDYRAACSR
jgi:hypothetical protein